MTSERTAPTPEIQISIREIEEYIRDEFAAKFGNQTIKRVSVGKYPDGYGVIVTVTEKDVDRMLDLIDELEAKFGEKGIEIGIATSTI